jgi:GT2 family glycosyltransferase
VLGVGRARPKFRMTAVIVNFNGASILPACLDSLLALDLRDLRLLVVDNASSDNPRSYVPKRATVELLQLPGNMGFAGAARAGVEEALRDSESAAIAILNNDLIFDKSWETLCRNVWDGRCPEGLYGPVLVNPDGSIQNMGHLWSPRTGNVTTRLSVTEAERKKEVLWLTEHEFVTGAAIVGNASVFRKINFDADLVLLCEDLDLCMQAHAAGIPVGIATYCHVMHERGATFRKYSGIYSYYRWRNGLLMSARYGSTGEFCCYLAWWPFQLVHHLLALAKHNDFHSLIPLLRGAASGLMRALSHRWRSPMSNRA